MRNLAIACFVLLAFLPAAAPAEPAPATLMPASPWDAHYADESCKLVRLFGTGKDRVILSLEATAPDMPFALMLAGRRLDGDGIRTRLEIGFGDQPMQRLEALQGTITAERLPMSLMSNVDVIPHRRSALIAPPDIAAENAIQRMVVKPPISQKFVLATGPMGAPLTAMRTCLDALVKYWGLDPAVQRTLTRGPAPTSPPRGWLASGDYPPGALSDGSSGQLYFRLMVGVDGKPTGCTIQSKTRPDSFAPIVCKVLMARARFSPALDAGGKPIASYYASAVRFIAVP